MGKPRLTSSEAKTCPVFHTVPAALGTILGQLVPETKPQEHMTRKKHLGTFTSYNFDIIFKKRHLPTVYV